MLAGQELDVHSQLRELIHAIPNFNASRYTSAAGYIILLWDTILTMPDEIRLIWPAPWGVVKILYFVNRICVPIFMTLTAYKMSGFAGHLSDHFCKSFIVTAAYAEIISLGLSNILLMLRVYALYGRKRNILLGLSSFFLASYVAIISITTVAIVQIVDHLRYSPILKMCITTVRPKIMGAIWVAPIGFEIVIFAMTFWKALEHAKILQDKRKSPVFYTMIRDGILYFSVIILVRLFNMVVWFVAPSSFLFIGVYFIWGFITALMSRLLLNLRGVKTAAQWSRATEVERKSNVRYSWEDDEKDEGVEPWDENDLDTHIELETRFTALSTTVASVQQ